MKARCAAAHREILIGRNCSRGRDAARSKRGEDKMRTILLSAGLICLMSATASGFMCGDANGDQTVNIGDPVYIVSYIFKSGPAPAPWEAGDANVDQSLNIGDAVYLINHIFKAGPPPCPNPTGSVVDHSDCLVLKDGGEITAYSDCIDYDYDGVGVLALTHRNVVYNCCVTEILAEFSISGNVITIVEDEYLQYGPCDCMCFFDVDMAMVDLPPGVYTIHVDELYIPYWEGDPNEDIEFTVDLTSATSGSYCVER